tara:strand:+ start:550 stop:1377 length:828 start_codon:yes stop_codon:yes gene_type:complete
MIKERNTFMKPSPTTKKIFFLVGMPRAGNTLLSSILNQNYQIAVTPNTITVDILYQIFQCQKISTFRNFPDKASFNNVAHHVFDHYYQDWKETYIIDRSPWGTPANLKMLREFHKDIKIIVLTRDLIEVLASFVRWSANNPDNFLDRFNLPIQERCEVLMRLNQIEKGLIAIENLRKPENKDISHFVRYKDLVNYPELVIKGIYDFLEIPAFPHCYTDLDQFAVNGMSYDDNVLSPGSHKNLHKIRTKDISHSDYDPYSLIPQPIIDKYKKDWLL